MVLQWVIKYKDGMYCQRVDRDVFEFTSSLDKARKFDRRTDAFRYLQAKLQRTRPSLRYEGWRDYQVVRVATSTQEVAGNPLV